MGMGENENPPDKKMIPTTTDPIPQTSKTTIQKILFSQLGTGKHTHMTTPSGKSRFGPTFFKPSGPGTPAAWAKKSIVFLKRSSKGSIISAFDVLLGLFACCCCCCCCCSFHAANDDGAASSTCALSDGRWLNALRKDNLGSNPSPSPNWDGIAKLL